MELRPWLQRSGISGRAFARRLKHTNSGLITLVCNGKREIPTDEIPVWADALDLKGEARARFIAEASADALPQWLLRELKATRARADRAERTIKSLTAFLSPSSADADLERALHDQDQSELLDLTLMLARANRRLAMLAQDPQSLRSASLKEVLAALVQARDLSLIPSLEALEAVAPASDTPAT